MLENLKPPLKVLPCRVRTTLEGLDPKDATILESAITDPAWTPHSLSIALSQRGLSISDRSIKKHQIQQCSCKQLGK
jgi:hypothetical protein